MINKHNVTCITNDPIGQVSTIGSIPFETVTSLAHPVAMVGSPTNKNQIFMLLYHTKSKEIKFIKYSLENNQFEEIQSDCDAMDLLGFRIKMPNNRSLIEKYLTKSGVTYAHATKSTDNPGISYQLLDFSNIKQECILVVINGHKPQSWTSSIKNENDSCFNQWFGIFNCKTMKFENYTTIQGEYESHGHYCTLYENLLFIAHGGNTTHHMRQNLINSINSTINKVDVFELTSENNYLPIKNTSCYDTIKPHDHDVRVGTQNAQEQLSNSIANTSDHELTKIYGMSVIELDNIDHNKNNWQTFVRLVIYGTDQQNRFFAMLNIDLKFAKTSPKNSGDGTARLKVCHIESRKYNNSNHETNDQSMISFNQMKGKLDQSNSGTSGPVYFNNFIHWHLNDQNTLVFMGGYFTPQNRMPSEMKKMFCFDCKCQQWKVCNRTFDYDHHIANMSKMESQFYQGSFHTASMLRIGDKGYYTALKPNIESKRTTKGRMRMPHVYIHYKHSTQLQIKSVIVSNENQTWNIARFLWIGYYKNSKNEKCYFKNLPKEMIQLILIFVDCWPVKRITSSMFE